MAGDACPCGHRPLLWGERTTHTRTVPETGLRGARADASRVIWVCCNSI